MAVRRVLAPLVVGLRHSQMCGRFTLTDPGVAMEQLVSLDAPSSALPRYNIAPSQGHFVVVHREAPPYQNLAKLRWGLDAVSSDRALLINARSETVNKKPRFRGVFHRHRCLVPADGFYEWKRDGHARWPYYIRRRGSQPFAMAGIWNPNPGSTECAQGAFAILTTRPNRCVSEIHDRMPVILPKAVFRRWLAPEPLSSLECEALFRPFPAEQMESFPVDVRVNSAFIDDSSCILRGRHMRQELLF